VGGDARGAARRAPQAAQNRALGGLSQLQAAHFQVCALAPRASRVSASVEFAV
jgi:hypothetical protein